MKLKQIPDGYTYDPNIPDNEQSYLAKYVIMTDRYSEGTRYTVCVWEKMPFLEGVWREVRRFESLSDAESFIREQAATRNDNRYYNIYGFRIG
jgi:hypothetical protein